MLRRTDRRKYVDRQVEREKERKNRFAVCYISSSAISHQCADHRKEARLGFVATGLTSSTKEKHSRRRSRSLRH